MTIADWADMFPSTISIQTVASTNAYGVDSYNTAVEYAGRVVYKNTSVINAAGEEVVARGAVWLQTTTVINTTDKITLPDGSTPELISVDRPQDQDGNHHIKLFFR